MKSVQHRLYRPPTLNLIEIHPLVSDIKQKRGFNISILFIYGLFIGAASSSNDIKINK
jgi:hypothetical protein